MDEENKDCRTCVYFEGYVDENYMKGFCEYNKIFPRPPFFTESILLNEPEKNCPKYEPKPRKESKKAEEGDYCRKNLAIIQKIGNNVLPCDFCDVRCVFAGIKEEKDYLLKKDDDRKETTKTYK